jgi:hypothetical protein
VTVPTDGAFLYAPADLAWAREPTPPCSPGSDLDPSGTTLQLFDLATGGVAGLLPGGTSNITLPDYKFPQQLRAILGWLPH